MFLSNNDLKKRKINKCLQEKSEVIYSIKYITSVPNMAAIQACDVQ